MAARRSACGCFAHRSANCQTASGSASMYSPTRMIACQRGSRFPSGAGRPGRIDSARVIARRTSVCRRVLCITHSLFHRSRNGNQFRPFGTAAEMTASFLRRFNSARSAAMNRLSPATTISPRLKRLRNVTRQYPRGTRLIRGTLISWYLCEILRDPPTNVATLLRNSTNRFGAMALTRVTNTRRFHRTFASTNKPSTTKRTLTRRTMMTRAMNIIDRALRITIA